MNTELNSADILVFDDATQSSITGTPKVSLNGFKPQGDVSIDTDLLPSTPTSEINNISERLYNDRFVGNDRLLNTTLPANIIDLVDLVCTNAQPGKWCRVDLQTSAITYHTSINADEQAIVFDVETFVKAGNYPIIAQAVSSSALWCWLHQSWDGTTPYTNTLVSIGNTPRTLIAHNVSFDAARIIERFQMSSPIAVIDTMSIINALHGMDSSSRWALSVKPGTNARADRLRKLGCGKSLVAAYNHCVKDGPRLSAADKSARNIFVDADTFSEFIDNRDELLTYSMMDVVYTLRLHQSMFPDFIKWSNGYSVLVGQNIVANSLLPVQPDRRAWINTCDDLYDDTFIKINSLVFEYFQELHTSHHNNTADLSHINVDWSLHKPKGWRKRHLPEGYPIISKWYYRFLMNNVGTASLDFSRLLQLEYFTQGKWRPLIHERSMGWHFINRVGSPERVPHTSGDSKQNVGNMMGSDSLRFFDDYDKPVLRSATLMYDDSDLYDLLMLVDSTSIWRGFGDRVKSQIVHCAT